MQGIISCRKTPKKIIKEVEILNKYSRKYQLYRSVESYKDTIKSK